MVEYDRRAAEIEKLRAQGATTLRNMLAAEDRELAALAEVDDLRDEVEQLRRQRAAVLALHQTEERAFANGDTREMCGECDVYWPCPTAKAAGVEA